MCAVFSVLFVRVLRYGRSYNINDNKNIFKWIALRERNSLLQNKIFYRVHLSFAKQNLLQSTSLFCKTKPLTEYNSLLQYKTSYRVHLLQSTFAKQKLLQSTTLFCKIKPLREYNRVQLSFAKQKLLQTTILFCKTKGLTDYNSPLQNKKSDRVQLSFAKKKKKKILTEYNSLLQNKTSYRAQLSFAKQNLLQSTTLFCNNNKKSLLQGTILFCRIKTLTEYNSLLQNKTFYRVQFSFAKQKFKVLVNTILAHNYDSPSSEKGDNFSLLLQADMLW